MIYKMNSADLDLVLVACQHPGCINEFEMPFDAFHMSGGYCGQCGKPEKFKIIADPAPIVIESRRVIELLEFMFFFRCSNEQT